MEGSSFASQIAESKTSNSFPNKFLKLLGKLSDSFSEHLKKVDSQKNKIYKEEAQRANQEKRKPSNSKKESIEQRQDMLPELTNPMSSKPPILKQKRAPETTYQKMTAKRKGLVGKKTSKLSQRPIEKALQVHARGNKKSFPLQGKSSPLKDLPNHTHKDQAEKTPNQKPQVPSAPFAQINKKKFAVLSESLKNIESQNQVQAPNLETLSANIIQSLKTMKHPLVRSITTQNMQQQQQDQSALVEGKKIKKEVKVAAKKIQTPHSHYQEDIEKLRAKVIKQVRLQVKLQMQQDKGNIHIQLKPRFLGKMQIELSLDTRSQAAQATFLVENQTVKEILQKDITQLADALEEKSIDLQEIHIHTDEESLNSEGKFMFQKNSENASEKWVQSFQHLHPNEITKGEGNPNHDDQAVNLEDLGVHDPEELLNIIA